MNVQLKGKKKLKSTKTNSIFQSKERKKKRKGKWKPLKETMLDTHVISVIQRHLLASMVPLAPYFFWIRSLRRSLARCSQKRFCTSSFFSNPWRIRAVSSPVENGSRKYTTFLIHGSLRPLPLFSIFSPRFLRFPSLLPPANRSASVLRVYCRGCS